jgi:hypothetical protein
MLLPLPQPTKLAPRPPWPRPAQLHSELNTIPSWVAVFAPLMMLALTVAVGEFLASRRTHASVTDAVSTFIYFFLDGVQVGLGRKNLEKLYKALDE